MSDDKTLADIYLQEIARGPTEFSNYWDNPNHDWGYAKFGYLPDDLFTELQWKCGNNILLPLLTRRSFLAVAADVAKVAQDRAGFEALLTKQMDKARQDKVNELLRPWNTFEILDFTPPKHKHWEIVDHMFKEKSFQTLVDFVLGILKDRDYFPEEASVPLSPYPSASDFEDDFEDSNASEHPLTKATPQSKGKTMPGSNDCASTASQTRKRSISPSLSDNGQGEVRPSKKRRLDNDGVYSAEVAPSISHIEPTPHNARRLRKTQSPRAATQPAVSTTTTLCTDSPADSSTTPSSLSELPPSQPSQQYRGPPASQKLGPGNNKDLESPGTPVRKQMAKSTKGPSTHATNIGQGDPHDPRREVFANRDLGQGSQRALWLLEQNSESKFKEEKMRKKKGLHRQSPSNPCAKPGNRVSKSTSRTPKSTRSTAQGRTRGAMHWNQTGSSQRVTRRTGPENQAFQELDSHGVARILQTPQ